MRMPVIIDLILAAVLLLFTVLGWRRGAFRSVIGIAVVAAALIGAGFVAHQGAPAVAKVMTPFVAEQIELRFEEAAQDTGTPGETAITDAEDAEGWFTAAGLYSGTAKKLAEDTVAQVRETGQAVLEAAVDRVIHAAAGAILFLLSFLIFFILLKIASKIFGLLTAVPGLHLIDCAAGGLLGLVQGSLVLFVAIWAAQFIGNGIPGETVEHAAILRLFVTLNPMMMISGV